MTTVRPAVQFVYAADQLTEAEAPLRLGPIDIGPILGVWRNPNSRSWGMSHIEVTRRDDTGWLHAWGIDPGTGESYDWGEAPIEGLYTDGPRSAHLAGYTATFDLDHAQTHVQISFRHGVTVIVGFTRFADGSDRQNFMTRELFYRA